jgi:hypothetical protein
MANIAIVVAMRCIVVPCADAGSSGIAAANIKATPATPSSRRPAIAFGPIANASPSSPSPTRKIARPTAGAAGSPGSARRLIVFCAGSYPGVTSPPTRTATLAKTGAQMPSTPHNRRTRQR